MKRRRFRVNQPNLYQDNDVAACHGRTRIGKYDLDQFLQVRISQKNES